MTDRKIRLLNLHGGKVNHEEKGKKKGKEAVQADRNCTSQAAGQGRNTGKSWEEMTGKGAAEQNLAHPPVRSKPIVPLEVAEVG